jgi:RNA polymerase sigma-70 factor (ECF subfamily)
MVDKKNEYSKIAEGIYDRHIDTVYSVCFMYMKNKQDTEDAVNNTFLKLLEKKKTFESEEHEKAWLIRVAINICKNTVTHWSRNSVDISELPLQAEEVHNDVLRQVLALPEELKIPVYLHYYAGYSSKEIGKLLHIADSSVRSRLAKARKILEKEL